jgi:hypothetical protein
MTGVRVPYRTLGASMAVRKNTRQVKFTDKISLTDLDGSIDTVISKLTKIKSDLTAKGFFDIRLTIETDYDYSEVYIVGSRLETQKEREQRLKKAAAERERRKKLKEAATTGEWHQYLKLKAKFDKLAPS